MRTKFIRSILTVILSATVTANVSAQNYNRLDAPNTWSVGANFGMSDFWGNVGTKSILDHYNNDDYLKNLHAMGGVFGRYSFSPAFSLKLAVNYGTVYATDRWNYKQYKSASSTSSDAYQRYARFQDIKDNIWEGSLSMQFEPGRMNLLKEKSRKAGKLYFHAGVGYFHYQPFSSLNGNWVKIHNLHLEGDGWQIPGAPAAYKLTGLCIPLGFGYRFDMGQHLNLGIEYSYRMTFIGYMDDVNAKYIDPKYFSQYLSPADAVIATALADKTRIALGPSAPANTPGTPRSATSLKDAYSTISIVFYYKVKSHGIPWWGY